MPNPGDMTGVHVAYDKTYGLKPTKIDGYTPKNKKLLTYPYTMLYASTRNGKAAVYRFEFFQNNEIKFSIDGGPVPNVEIGLSPKNYKNEGINYDETFTLTGYPFVPFACDVYKTWLAQNAYNIPINIASAGLSLGVGIATGNPLAIAGGVLGVASELSSIATHSIIPDQAKGMISGSSLIGREIMNFYLVQKSITAEYAEKIDDYFTMYGYKQNKMMIPSFLRPHWNYIKTIDCNITGPVPESDLQELKNIYNNGCTFWNNGDYIGNYWMDNSIPGGD